MTRPPRVLGALLLGAVLACIPARAARAAETGVSVEQSGCGGVDTGKVEQLIELELAGAFGTSDHGLDLSVTLTCEPGWLRIDVLDPVTNKDVGRRYPAMSPDEREPERAVALAAAQLFVVSWLELLVPRGAQPTDDEVPRETVEDAREAASKRIDRHVPEVEVSAVGGARMRDLPDLVPVAHVGLHVGGRAANLPSGSRAELEQDLSALEVALSR